MTKDQYNDIIRRLRAGPIKFRNLTPAENVEIDNRWANIPWTITQHKKEMEEELRRRKTQIYANAFANSLIRIFRNL